MCWLDQTGINAGRHIEVRCGIRKVVTRRRSQSGLAEGRCWICDIAAAGWRSDLRLR